jgi:Flp pilus assembly protein CpaB
VELTAKRYKGGGGFRRALSTRRGTILVAGACTAMAAAVLLFAASRYRESVNASGQPQTVLVATSVIQKGTPGSVISTGGMFRSERIVAKQVSAGAIADAAALRGKVAATDINPGQQLTLGLFTTGGGYGSQLAPDQRVMSVPLDASHGLAGVLHGGDRVDVYAGVNASLSGGGSSASANAAVRLLLSNVPVLAVGQNNGSGVGGGNGVSAQSDVVLKVSARDAGALAFAADNGKVWLVLRGPNAKDPKTQTQALYTINSLLLGSKPISAGKP